MGEIDFALSWSVKAREYFVRALIDLSSQKKLSFLWCCNENVTDVTKELIAHSFKIKFLLDTEATYNKARDPYVRLCYAVKDAGGVVINDPDRARLSVDKSVMHYELINAGVTTPYTVIVRNWEPKFFRLKEEEKERLGMPFVIKPASGYARQGVIEKACGTIREIAQARQFDTGDNFLLQEKITPVEYDGRRGWFRVFHIFHTIIPCWWDDTTNRYQHITSEEMKKYKLNPLIKIVSKIADITQMQWFSTEIAVDRKNGEYRFIAIDYVNDQCDMTAQSESEKGVPDPVVEKAARYIIESAEKLINQEAMPETYRVWLEDATVSMRGLGKSPKALTQAQ